MAKPDQQEAPDHGLQVYYVVDSVEELKFLFNDYLHHKFPRFTCRKAVSLKWPSGKT